MKNLMIVISLGLVNQSCSVRIVKARDFDPASPVVAEKSSIGQQYKQGDEIVRVDQMAYHFHSSPHTRDIVRFHSAYMLSGLGLAAFGGALIGFNLGTLGATGKVGSYATLGAGIVSVASGMYLEGRAYDKLDEAIKLHNQSFPTHQTSSYIFRALTVNF